MPRKKKISTEIVLQHPVEDVRGVLGRMVRDAVAEIMAERAEALPESSFQPREVAYESRRRQTVFERRKWSLYFAKWGCRMCRRKKINHSSAGCCAACTSMVANRLSQIKIEYDRDNPDTQIAENIDRLSRRLRSAQEL
jgi:hypothetical protein